MTEEYYNKVLGIVKKYLSYGAKDFLDRQIIAHLGKKALDEIEVSDSIELSKWCIVSGSLLLGPEKAKALAADISMVEEMAV